MVNYIKFYKSEMIAHKIYLILSERESDENIRIILKKNAEMEKYHAEFWKNYLEKVPNIRFSLRFYFYLFIYKLFGLEILMRFLEIDEKSAIKEYYNLYKNNKIKQKDKERLKKIIEDELLHEDIAANIINKRSNLEHIRDKLLGMNDALVEILASLSGLVGLKMQSSFAIGITGSIIGVSGMLSMALGSYLSVKNQKEVKEKMNEEKSMLKDIGKDVEMIEITENPLYAAYYTGKYYLIGTIIVVLPFFLGFSPLKAFFISILAAVFSWIIAAVVIALNSGVSIFKKIVEMLLIGGGTTFITYLLGTLLNSLMG